MDMPAVRPLNAGPRRQKIVAVLASAEDLRRAARLRRPPDLFELRLDYLRDVTADVEHALRELSAPVILTARHPREGGANNLSAAERRRLLLQFLERAAYVDVELRSLRECRPVMQEAQRLNTRRILSVHDIRSTPTTGELRTYAARARTAGADIFKLATRIDTQPELGRVLEFFDAHQPALQISAMGFGKLGRIARIELIRRGSILNYAHLGAPLADGQLSLAEMRRLKSFR